MADDLKKLLEGDFPPLMPAQLAQLMGCNRSTVDAALKAGTIKGVRVGRRWFIPRNVARQLVLGEIKGDES